VDQEIHRKRRGWLPRILPEFITVTRPVLRSTISDPEILSGRLKQANWPIPFLTLLFSEHKHILTCFRQPETLCMLPRKNDGSISVRNATDVPVSSTVPSKDGKTVFAADVDAHIYSFDALTGSRNWKMRTDCGTALSIACDAQDRLFIVTTKGTLACVDVHPDSIKAAAEGRAKKIREVHDVKEIAVVQPDMDVEQTKEVGTGVLLECVHDLSNDEVLKIHNALHDRTVKSVDIQGETFTISTNDSDCRFAVIHQLTFIEQNKTKASKYATMAIEGHKVTWVVNGGRWGLVVDKTLERNGTACVVRVSSDPTQSTAGANLQKDLTVQFPKNLREVGRKFVVDSLVLAEDKTFFRTQGTIKSLQ